MTVPSSDLDPDHALDTTDPEISGHLAWQLVLPVGFIVLGTMILVASTQFPDTAAAVTAPGLYPGIVSVVLIVASLLSLGELFAVRRSRTEPGPTPEIRTDEERRDSRKTWARAVTVTVLSALYVVAIPYAGFVVTTFLYCFAISLMLRGRSVRGAVGAVLIAGGLVAAAYYGFAVGLHAPLPKGVLF